MGLLSISHMGVVITLNITSSAWMHSLKMHSRVSIAWMGCVKLDLKGKLPESDYFLFYSLFITDPSMQKYATDVA